MYVLITLISEVKKSKSDGQLERNDDNVDTVYYD